MIKRIVHKAKNYRDAEEWDILQHIRMTAEERQDAAKELKMRVYGRKAPMEKQISNPKQQIPKKF